MINSKKKGFTIVELVIVIAVIAVLAAVLIPTFSNLVKKANMSADQMAVKQMNTTLSVVSVEGNPDEFRELIDILDGNGYNVKSLTPLSKGYIFVWNKTENKIEMVEDSTATDNVTIFNLATGSSYIDIQATSAKTLKEALESGNDVTLTKNVENAAEIIIPEGANITLDLGGYSITTETVNPGANTATSKYIKIEKNATVTIENGTFTGRGIMNEGTLIIKETTTINAVDVSGGGCIRNKPGGTVIIEGGTFNVPNYIEYEDEHYYGGAAVIYNDGGTLTINNGNFNSNTDAYLISSVNGGTLTINNGNFTARRGALYTLNATITVENGNFKVTEGAQSGWLAYADGDTGSIVINSGEFVTVTDNVFNGNVIDNR